jgi:hypothetical protein
MSPEKYKREEGEITTTTAPTTSMLNQNDKKNQHEDSR